MRSYPDAQSPEDIARLFVDAWQQKNADYLASLFTEDAEFVNVVGIWWHSRDEIRNAHTYGFEKIFGDSDLKLGRIVVKKLSDTIAVVHARMRLTGQTSHNNVQQPAMRQNIFTFVTQHIQDRWMCVSAHNTDIVPGKETNAIDKDGRFISLDYRT